MIGREAKHLAVAVAVMTLAIFGVGAGGQEHEEEEIAPQLLRATQRAGEREERRAGMDVVARETIRAARAEDRRRGEQPVEVRNPLPLPVEVRNAGTLLGGKPAAGICSGAASCTLTVTPSVREVLVVTAVWSATRIECDGTVAAAPAGGAPIAPWWHCKRQFSVEGPGAGYTGFIIVQ